MRRMIDRALAMLRGVERALLGAIMLAMVALYGINVAVREIMPAFASDVAWIDEATRYLMVWLVFLGLGLALERGRHVAMSSLVERLPERARDGIARLVDLVGLLFALYLAKLGADIALLVGRLGQISPTLGISAAWLYAVLPIGFGLLALRYLLELVGVTRRTAFGSADLPQGH